MTNDIDALINDLKTARQFDMEGLMAVCGEAADALAQQKAEIERLRRMLTIWRDAYATGRNEPLVRAAEEHDRALKETDHDRQ